MAVAPAAGGGCEGRGTAMVSPDSGSTPDASPDAAAAIPGGGTSGGPITGKIEISVLEDGTATPIADAFVQVGETVIAGQSGLTDARGFISIAASGINGPQTVTAGKLGYRTACIADLDATHVTLVLRPLRSSRRDTATMRGTVDFTGLPPLPSPTQVRAAAVLYQLSEALRDPRSDIPQPSTGGIPDYTYIPGPPANKNEWVLTTPTGTVHLFALVFDVETNGSFSAVDWSYKLTDIGLLDGLTIARGEDKGGIVIPLSGRLDQALSVMLPPPPAGMSVVEGFAVINRGPGKLIPVLLPGIDHRSGIPGPKLEGAFAGASLWAVASSSNGDALTGLGITRATVSVVRGLTGYQDPVVIPPFMPLPENPLWIADGVSYAPIAEASFHEILVKIGNGDEVWNVTVLDRARTNVRIPDLPSGASLETIPAGALSLAVSAAVIPGFDPRMARFKDLANVVSKLATNEVAAPR